MKGGYFILVLFALSVGLQVNSRLTNSSVVDALNSIFKVHFSKSAHPLHIFTSISENNSKARYYFEDLVDDVLRNIHIKTVLLNFNTKSYFRSFYHFDLILVDTVESFRLLYEEMLEIATQNLSFTIVVIMGIASPDHADIHQMLQMLWKLSILNVGILLEQSSDDIIMVTYMPFQNDSCQIQKPTVVNRFNDETRQWQTNNFFPRKLRNFHGCRLTCATWEDMPYFHVNYDENHNVQDLTGVEGKLLNFMSKNLNFKLDLYMMNEKEISDSFNSSGFVFQEMFNKSVDYAMGAFNYRGNLDVTAPFSQSLYYYQSHIRLVTNLFNEYSTYEKLAFPFDRSVWLIIVLTFLLACLVIWLTSLMESRKKNFIIGSGNNAPYYNVFTIALGAPYSSPLPIRNFCRFLLSIWMLATLVLRNAYQSGMYRMLRDNTQRDPPQTIQSVLARKYLVAIRPENVRYLASLPEVENFQFLNLSELQSFASLAEPDTPPTAIITPYEYFGHFRQFNSLSRFLHLVREPVFIQQLTFYVKRNSYLVSVLNEQIHIGWRYGFLPMWKRELVGNENDDQDDTIAIHTRPSFNENSQKPLSKTSRAVGSSLGTDSHSLPSASVGHKPKQSFTSPNDKDNSNVLSMDELEGLFWIILWIYLISGLVFLLEIIHFRTRQSFRWRPHRLLKLLQKRKI